MSPGNCPHCGGEGKIKKIPTPFMHGWVGCPVCKIYKQWSYDPSDAIRIWNMRDPSAALGMTGKEARV